MNKIRVGIIDDDKLFCKALEDDILNEENITLVGIKHDGEEGLELIRNNNLDVVILDVIMPKLDGMSLLEQIDEEELENKPYIIIASEIGQEEITNKALKLGAAYYMIKPFYNMNLIKRINDLYNLNHSPIVESNLDIVKEKIIIILKEVSMYKNTNSCDYLIDAILYTYEDKTILRSITKELYPMIAKKYNTTSGAVERLIRKMIETAYNNYKFIDYTDKKPTNAEFIISILEEIDKI